MSALRLTTPDAAFASTKRFYNKNAKDYARRTRELPVAVIEDTFTRHLVPNARVLDLGSGSGRDLKCLRHHGHRPVGVDYSVALAAEARSYSNCEVIVGDILALPVRRADGIIIVGTLSHFESAEVVQILKQSAEALAPGSPIYISVKIGFSSGLEGARWMHYYTPKEIMRLVNEVPYISLRSVWTTASALESSISWLNAVLIR